MFRSEKCGQDVPLASLGQRIVILGPSNAGKSTLAAALSEKLEIEPFHLDRMRFLPNTDWSMRSDADFQQLHDDAVAKESWIMEGNYSALWAPRLERATGFILLNSSTSLRLIRYLRRTLINPSGRAGHLEGAKDSLKWEMIDWILFKTRKSAERSAKVLRSFDQPLVECHSAAELRGLYRTWALKSPD